MGIYAGLGVAQASATFLMGSTFALLTYFASQRLHEVCAVVILLRNLLTLLLGILDGYRARTSRANVFLRFA